MTTEATATLTEVLDSNLLERAIRKIARSSDASKRLASKRTSQVRTKNSGASDLELKTKAAKIIVRGHALRSGIAGGGTGMLGAIPGVGTAAAISAGVSTDFVLQMKADVDMCHALVYVFKPHMREDEAFSLAVTLATYGRMEKRGVKELGGAATKLASKAGVKIVRQQLRGSALIATKQAFKRVGIVFTRKAVEKAIPFGVGAVIGSGVNASITTYVGHQARKWLELDATTPDE